MDCKLSVVSKQYVRYFCVSVNVGFGVIIFLKNQDAPNSRVQTLKGYRIHCNKHFMYGKPGSQL